MIPSVKEVSIVTAVCLILALSSWYIWGNRYVSYLKTASADSVQVIFFYDSTTASPRSSTAGVRFYVKNDTLRMISLLPMDVAAKKFFEELMQCRCEK
jgi:hypothetical protein